MSYENFPNDRLQPEPDLKEQSGKWRNYLTAGLIIADKSKAREIIQKKDVVINTTSTQRDQLQKELEDATMRYDMIKTSNANMLHSKDSTITRRDREIADKKNRIQQLLSKVDATQEELAEAKGLIASLNTDIVGYKARVEKLEAEKVALTNEKNTVIMERNKVLKDFDSVTNVVAQKENIIDVASTLSASNFSIQGINERSNGKEKETTVAKRVDKLRISFDLDENRVAQSGLKNIYVCITAPDGKELTEEKMGSGKFSTRDGELKSYTQKLDVNYTQGKRQTLSIDWKQNTDFTTGEYKIEVYNNGFKIGEGICSLKKGGLFS